MAQLQAAHPAFAANIAINPAFVQTAYQLFLENQLQVLPNPAFANGLWADDPEEEELPELVPEDEEDEPNSDDEFDEDSDMGISDEGV